MIKLARMLGVPPSDGKRKYLGLPFLVESLKKEMFSYIRKRVGEKTRAWKEKYLTRVEKEILIKLVLQAIPTYVMFVFLLSETWCEEVTSIIQKF